MSFRERLLTAVGNPLQWSLADRCLLTAVISLFFGTWYVVVQYVVLVARPEIAPYLNREFIQRTFAMNVAIYCGGWLLISVEALVLRRRLSNSLALVHGVAQYFGVTCGYAAYCFGPATSPVAAVILLAGAALGYTLFDKLPVTLAAVSLLAVLIGSSVAAQLGWISYAPLLAAAPFRDGRLATSWLATLGGLTFALTTFVFLLLYFIIDRWHDHEGKLAQTSDQLARANDLISRYIAAQVVEQIRAGNYDAVDRQDRRRLTLFFSDIKGFTEIADRLEPEELSEILNEYFTEMTAIAGHYGGTIDKFMGDAIMIFYGAPVATHDQDHALRAVRMAMAMQARMAELGARWEKRGVADPFTVRIGINTGVASVGNFGAAGRMDYTAMGRQVNLAARLQVSCDPGRVLISHATWVLVRDEIECVPKGEIQVKGIREPLKVYEVTALYSEAELPPARSALSARQAS